MPAPRNLLQIVNACQQELGIPVSATIVGNTDLTTVQLLALVQDEIEELRQAHDWTALQVEFDLVIPVPIITTGSILANSLNVIRSIPSTAGISANSWAISGNGIPVAARVLSVDSATQVTMTMQASGAMTAQQVTFSQDTYSEPPDFDHFQNYTWWDRTNHWRLLGPDSPQTDQWQRSGIVALGPRRHFRQLGTGIAQLGGRNWRIWPAPVEIIQPLQLVYEYISRYAILLTGTGGAYSDLWTNDTDIPILDDRCIIRGLKWRFWEQKGLNFLPKRQEYMDYRDRLIARDGGSKTLDMVKRYPPTLVSGENVQDGFWPGSTSTNSN